MLTKISDNFYLEEFWANSDTAKKHNIDNTPSEDVKRNIKKLAVEILEPIRKKYGDSIYINCGYRCPALNKAVGGSSTSQHVYGQAADIRGKGNQNKKLWDCIMEMIESGDITVGQLIWEFGTSSNPAWIHISLPYSKTNNIIKSKKVNGKTVYTLFK